MAGSHPCPPSVTRDLENFDDQTLQIHHVVVTTTVTLRERSALLPTLLAVTVLFATADRPA